MFKVAFNLRFSATKKFDWRLSKLNNRYVSSYETIPAEVKEKSNESMIRSILSLYITHSSWFVEEQYHLFDSKLL